MGSYSSDAPHFMQNFAFRGFLAPQYGQVIFAGCVCISKIGSFLFNRCCRSFLRICSGSI